MAYQSPVTVTGLLNVMTMFEAIGTLVAFAAGVVVLMAGRPSALLRGVGAPVTKSVELLSVSVAPPVFRMAAVVLLIVAVGPVPSKQFVPAPYPTKSMTCGPVGQAVAAGVSVVTFSNATFPAPSAIAMVPAASGAGRAGAETFDPAAS